MLREQFRPLITARGIRAVARETGIHQGTLSQWLSGHIPAGRSSPRRLTDDQLTKLANTLNVTLQLIPGKENDNAGCISEGK